MIEKSPIDFFSQIKTSDKKVGFQKSLLHLCEKMMAENLTENQRMRLAQLRAYIDINFKDFN